VFRIIAKLINANNIDTNKSYYYDDEIGRKNIYSKICKLKTYTNV